MNTRCATRICSCFAWTFALGVRVTARHASTWWLNMDFAQRLAAFRTERGLTQQPLANRVAVRLSQINRHESDASQPRLDVIRPLAIALTVFADEPILGKHEPRNRS